MNPLRILHLGKYYPPARGGIETVVETLCRGDATWANSEALVMNTERSTVCERRDGVTVRRTGSVVTCGAVSLSYEFPRWLARAEADVIVLHEPNPMALFAYYLARPAVPLLIWYHSEVVRASWKYRIFYHPLLEFALRRAVRVIVASPPMQEVPALRAHRHKCVVVPYGLPMASDSVDAASRTSSGHATRATLLFVGRLVRYKGVDVLLKAMSGLDADLVIVGDGPRRRSLETLAHELGVATQVRFLGNVSQQELIACLRACDIFVLPSVTRQEAFGLVQLEAMACGRPVISTDLGTGVAWVNQHGQTGLVVKPGDAMALRGAIATLIGDAALRRRLGQQARTHVETHFTAEKMCSAMRSLYLDLVPGASETPQGEPARVA